jgi:preprotein translocase subunit YajC
LNDVVLSLVPFLLIIVVFWFFLIRPQMRRQRETQQMQAALTVGCQVMLTSGIFGTVTELTEEHVGVTVADSVQIKVIRGAIGRVIPTGLDEGAGVDDTPDGVDDVAADETSAERAKPEENE